MRLQPSIRLPRQAGAALATALILLIVLTLLGLSAARSGKLALRLADNEQSRVEALEIAQSLVDTIADDATNLPIQNGTGYGSCFLSPASAEGTSPQPPASFSCASNDVDLLDGRYPHYVYAQTERLAPERLPMQRGFGSSALNYSGALFQITAGYDRRGDGQSAAEISEGIVRLQVQSPGQYVFRN